MWGAHHPPVLVAWPSCRGRLREGPGTRQSQLSPGRALKSVGSTMAQPCSRKEDKEAVLVLGPRGTHPWGEGPKSLLLPLGGVRLRRHLRNRSWVHSAGQARDNWPTGLTGWASHKKCIGCSQEGRRLKYQGL